MNTIQLAAKLYEARDAARAIFGASYAEALTITTKIVNARAAKDKTNETTSAIALAKEAETIGSQTLFLASIVEAEEPSGESKANA